MKEGSFFIHDFACCLLTFLISGVPAFKEAKLFSVPAILDGTLLQVFEIVEDWDLFENISALCFDTTTSNIEWKNGERVVCFSVSNPRFDSGSG
ncbi:hypothetical protein AVEN_258638-1 [Araneus ventricosus]|uniref:Uncharacterized protein n=1 Tax=Araneus ventricosus TaxID=182803 RepID=A0A4Y2XAC5_ARAVE|nr:hypothetical protein AVEN_258638-1 [Araneus ventricosus]